MCFFSRLVTETIECITRVTVDCGPSKRLLIAEMMKRVKFMSVIACRVIEEPEVDPMACIGQYRELGQELLAMTPYRYVSITVLYEIFFSLFS